jgi:protein ImuB
MKSAPRQMPLIDIATPRKAPVRAVVCGEPPMRAAVPDGRRPRRAWLALRFHQLPLMAAMKGLELSEHTAVAVVADDRQRRVIACNALAARNGIRPGHTSNAAIAIHADVKLLARRTLDEAAELRDLATLCNDYSPLVTLESDCELLIEVRGSLRLFGGVDAFLRRVREDLAHRGWQADMALTPTALASLWHARCATPGEPCIVPPRRLAASLAHVPIASMHWPTKVVERLNRFGVQTLGELTRLPRDGLAKRIGASLLRELDQARGRMPSVHIPVRSRLTYADHIQLDFDIETSGLLEQVLERRLGRLQRFLRERSRAIREVEFRLVHRDIPPTSLTVSLASPSSDITRLGKLLHEKLARYRLAAPIRQVSVHAHRLEVPSPESGSLLIRPGHSQISTVDAKAQLLEQLETRLGVGFVRQPRHHAERRPERAASSERASVTSSTIPVEVPATLAPRPLWMLPTPATWRPPGRGSILRGPERIRSGWWDGDPAERAYWVVQLPNGPRLWIFQDLITSGWYLHGVFA